MFLGAYSIEYSILRERCYSQFFNLIESNNYKQLKEKLNVNVDIIDNWTT